MAVVIKDPCAMHDDLTLHPPPTSNVRTLKELISSSHPLRPSCDAQKLIFAGKVLNDHQLLTDVFKMHEDNDVHVIHLILKLGLAKVVPEVKTPAQATSAAVEVSQPAPAETIPAPIPVSAASPVPPTEAPQPPPQSYSSQFYPQQAAPTFTPMPEHHHYLQQPQYGMDPLTYMTQMQMMGAYNPMAVSQFHMQQALLQQQMMMMNYQMMGGGVMDPMAYYQFCLQQSAGYGYAATDIPQGYASTEALVPPSEYEQETPPPPVAGVPQIVINVPAPANNNNAAGANENEEDDDDDWDWQRRREPAWKLFGKLALCVALIGRDMPYERLFWVVIVAIVIFLQQTGRFRIFPDVPPPQPQPAAAQDDENNAENQVRQPIHVVGGARLFMQTGTGSALKDFAALVAGFFSSLIPAPYVPEF